MIKVKKASDHSFNDEVCLSEECKKELEDISKKYDGEDIIICFKDGKVAGILVEDDYL